MLSWLVYGYSFTNGRIYYFVLNYREEIILGIWTVGWTSDDVMLSAHKPFEVSLSDNTS